MRKRNSSIERWNALLSLILWEWQKLVKKEHSQGEEKSGVVEMVFIVVVAGTVSAND